MAETLLELDAVDKMFRLSGGRTLRAVRSVSLSLESGEALGIVGESGCGKTTLARLVLRLTDASAGAIRFDGHDITRMSERDMRPLRRHVQAVFQDPYASLNPRLRIEAVIEEPLRAFGFNRTERTMRVREALDVVGLPEEALTRFPHALSGGQRQRVGIARALVLRPKLLVCDEAVSALDVSVQAQILNLLRDIRDRSGASMLFISHNLAVVRHLCQRIAVMYLGEIVELASERALFEDTLHPYTRGLLASVLEPRFDVPTRERNAQPLVGEMPSPTDPPRGCGFRTRCPSARGECETPPELREWRPGHWARCHFADELD